MNTQKTVQQEFGTVEESDALRLEAERAEQIVDALNTNVANVYTLYHQLRKHHWNVEGAEFRDLHLFLGEAAENADEAADELAERAGAIGGTPVAGLDGLQEHATVEAEDRDVYDIRTSLERDMEMYGDIIETMRDHVELAQNLGDHTTAQIVREILVQVEKDAHHVEHYLENDTLVFDGAMN
jgi:starvation-inducible DNA-binding protein